MTTQYYTFTHVASTYGAGTYDSSNYNGVGTTGTGTSGTGTTGGAGGTAGTGVTGGSLSNTGVLIGLIVGVSAVTLLAAMIVRIWRRPAATATVEVATPMQRPDEN